MVMAAFLLIHRLSNAVNIRSITNDINENEKEDEHFDPYSIEKRDVPKDVEIFEVQGPFFFGMISSFLEAVQNIEKKPKIRIIRMRYASFVDETALNGLQQTYSICKRHGIRLILSGVHPGPLASLKKCGLLDKIGEKYIFSDIDKALTCVREMLGEAEESAS